MTSDTRKIQDRYITDIRVHRDALKNVVDILRRQGKPLGLRDKELDECDAILAADAELKSCHEIMEREGKELIHLRIVVASQVDMTKLFKERWELEQIRYEGISSANE